MPGKDLVGESKDKLAKASKKAVSDIPSPKEGLKTLHNAMSSIKNTKEQEGFPECDYASLCVLSYERPDFLSNTLDSLKKQPGHPYELIVHDDGSTKGGVYHVLEEEIGPHNGPSISTLITNAPGHNQGQGTSLNRMFTIATGDPIIKLDADLKYYAGWLSETIRLMSEYPDIGLLGLLHYYHEPVDSRETVIERHDDMSIHTHILGSAFAVRRKCWEELGPFSEHSEAFAEDWEFQKKVTESKNWKCALPKESLVENLGMGLETSTVVVAEGETQHIYTEPFVIGRK